MEKISLEKPNSLHQFFYVPIVFISIIASNFANATITEGDRRLEVDGQVETPSPADKSQDKPKQWGFATQEGQSSLPQVDEPMNVFLITGHWDITNQSAKFQGNTTPILISSHEYVYEMAYLRKFENLWIGPFVAGANIASESESSASNLESLQFGMEIRNMIPTKGNAYVALSVNASWVTMDEKSISSNTMTVGSYSGFSKGASIGLGNRVGSTDKYLVETSIGVGQVDLSGKYSNTEVVNSEINYYMAITIGHLF